jgi:hypothetical protein
VRVRLGVLVAAAVSLLLGVLAWFANASTVNPWVAVHTGVVDEPGPYYAFWSGFGSDIAEFGLVGAVTTGVYQLVKKYNCHQPGCWRIGNHPAAGGQFYLCWRHHPDYAGGKPTKELIARLHHEHQAHQLALHARIQEAHEHLRSEGTGPPASANATRERDPSPLD